jgi:hypothetical protein
MPALSGVKEAPVNFVATGDNTVITAVVGTNIQILKIEITASAATNIIFKDGSTGLTGAMTMAVGVPLVFEESYDGIPWFTAAGNFVINQSGTAQISGRVVYVQI